MSQTVFTYRVRPVSSKAILLSGSGRIDGDSWAAVVRDVLRRSGVQAVAEYYDSESIMAGCVWRTRFYRNGIPVDVSISPVPWVSYGEAL